ncbi:MAG: LptF/LptG family permease [Planctomycetaceae bacterium]|jgi:lipopolysaccharide export system permease protein|nr:LptF/LptG family permease [Planctomycetaceae bacterium]
MNILRRYILWELFYTFFLSFLAMTALLIIGGLVQEAISKNVPLTHVIQLVPYVVVAMSRISLPMTLLLTATVFFARMSGNNEIIALKSLGISPWKILYPVMLFGILVSLFAVWLNEMAVTWGRVGMNTVIYRAAEDILLEQLKQNHSFKSPKGDITIMVKGVENRRLIAPTITLAKPPTTVEAQDAQLKIDFAEQTLTIVLHNLKVESKDTVYSGQTRTIPVMLSQIVLDTNAEPSASNMGFAQLAEEEEKLLDDIGKQRRTIAAKRVFASCMGSVDEWSTREIKELSDTNRWLTRRVDRLIAEHPRRWSTGFSCFFFIWLGAPMAIWLKKGDIFTSFFACFIPILLFYYPLLMYGINGAKNGSLPPNAVWLANIGLGVAGCWFLRRIHRY